MASSLESLVGNLGLEKLKETKKEFGDKFNLLSRKGIYPYDFMNSIKKVFGRKTSSKRKILFEVK